LVGKVLEIENILSPELLATRLTERYMEWDGMRNTWKVDKEEIRRYVYATDTGQTSNAANPWKNRTTVPKLCQIRDNLYSNYTATLFPKRKWLVWEANTDDSNSVAKADAITNYMSWAIEQPTFKHELDKIILDYIDFGNCFATVEWVDQRIQQPGYLQTGYIGPAIRRINPLDLVMNPTSEDFMSSPKFVRSIISLGELKKLLDRMTNDENQETYQELYKYLKDIRLHCREFQGDWSQRDRLYAIDGFSSFRAYLLSGYVEVLTFYGDWYDPYSDEYQTNRVITVVDRHRLISNMPNPSFFGQPPIYHVPWRKRQDNLWGMGPLDNLVGMQYRMDHIENMKADIFDLCTYPVQKIKGFVEDFVWQPGEKIFTSDEGDVELVVPEVNALSANMEIANLAGLMEEMAGAPKEAMGFRSPGEKTKYEVQRLENASARIFQNKINQFEQQMVEPLLNAMLELAQRNLSGATTIRVFDDEFKATTFQTLTVEDITGIGRIKPIAARHFAEQAELIQNLTSLAGSGLFQLVQPHMSGVQLSKMFDSVFDTSDYHIFQPFVSLTEQAEAQSQVQALQEYLHKQMSTATGMGEDYDANADGSPQPPTKPAGPTPDVMGLQRNPPSNATPTGTLGTQ
jgi:hypothetical protein